MNAMRLGATCPCVLTVMGIALVTACCVPAGAATIPQKLNAIERGLEYLAQQQQGNGRWIYDGSASNDCAATGAALKTFLKAGYAAGNDVVINGTNYGDAIGSGLNYVFSMGQRLAISNQVHGNPDTNGNGEGVRFGSGQDIMVSGLVIPGIVATGTPYEIVQSGPLAGKTYYDVVQDTVDYFAYAQVENRGPFDGGWRYSANYTSSDQSCSPWPILGMLASRESMHPSGSKPNWTST